MARLQSRIAFEALTSEFERVEPLSYQWGQNSMLMGLDSLTVALG